MYAAEFVKKKKLFQKHYTIDENMIYITNTKKSKKKFLKSGIKNVVFRNDIINDEVFSEYARKMYAYDSEFVEKYGEEFLKHIISFLKMANPVDEIALFSEKMIDKACKYSKLVTVVGEGKDRESEGIYIRHVKKIVKIPSVAIVLNGERLPCLPGTAVVDLRENCMCGNCVSSWETMSFKTDILPFEISAASLLYLLKTENFSYEITSLRKKLPELFTFC